MEHIVRYVAIVKDGPLEVYRFWLIVCCDVALPFSLGACAVMLKV